ncbi:hypothetical protein PG985_005807 [Apiospora marii]|uniref:uncharacterized protein n=1 Tax=Apiospora marii TaxID=335849 RepID=UPI0031328C4D
MPFGNTSDASSSIADNDSILTPATSSTASVKEIWDGHCFPSTPWPGNTYQIVEKVGGRPIICHDGNVLLSDLSKVPKKSWWLCVESNNHMGFQNLHSGCHLGHDGNEKMQARTEKMKDWEHIIARPHPQGGYQLLSKYWWHSLKVIVVGGDGKSLIRQMHGNTFFEFKKL